MAEDNRSKDFADALVEDPANPPQLQALTGYRGRSAKEGHGRLYLDPELSRWVDIPDDAVLLTREVKDEHGLGKSVVWAKLDAQIEHGLQAAAGGTGADFLHGQVAQDLGGGAAAGYAARPVHTQINCPTHAPFLCLQTPPRLCPPHTSNPVQCPSLGIACTFLPPCPQHTGLQCLPPQTNPQFCPVATPNPGCFPGGTIGNPGGPVEGGQVAEAFRNVAPPAITWPPCMGGVTHGCPPPNTSWNCTAPPSFGCPPHTPFCPTHFAWCQIATPAVGTQRELAFQAQAVQPVHPTVFCPVFTHNFHQCVPQTLACPVSPWCPVTFPVTGPGTTPQQLTPQVGQFGGARVFDAPAQGGGAADARFQPLHPTAQFQATHVVFNCLHTHNPQQCYPSVFCPSHPAQACQPVSPWCPIGTFPGPGTTPQFGGGGGFGGGF
jgi:hypothetical protein